MATTIPFNTTRDANIGAGCLSLFSLPFAACGLFMLYLTFSCLWNWRQMSAWVETPATIVSVSVDHVSGSKSETHRVVAYYRYRWEGVEYDGHRVTMHSGSDSFSFHDKLADTLRGYKNKKRPFPCYVNPAHPADAILIRVPRWDLLGMYTLFAIVFGGVGFGLLLGSWYGRRKLIEEKKLALQYPDMPWKWKSAWASGIIASTQKSDIAANLIFAVLWNAISCPILFIFPEKWHKGNTPILMALIFPAVGMWLAWRAVRSILLWRKFGTIQFHMERVPGVLGGKLAGVVRVSSLVPPAEIRVTLACLNKITEGSGKSKSTTTTTLWEETKTFRGEQLRVATGGHLIPILFALPFDAKSSDDSVSSDTIEWRLKIESEIPGIDFDAEFIVPVFKTAESAPDFQLSSAEQTLGNRLETQVSLADELAQHGVRLETRFDGSQRFVCPPARSWTALGVVGGVGLVLAGITAACICGHAPVIFSIVAGAFTVLMAWSFLDLCLFHSEVILEPSCIQIFSGWGNAGLVSHAPEELDSIEISNDGQAGSTNLHGMRIHFTNGKSLYCLRYFPGRSTVQKLADLVVGIYPKLRLETDARTRMITRMQRLKKR